MSYTYDARNLQLTITNDIIGKTVGYTYDERGRKVALTYPDGETITYTRDSRGQVARLASDQPGPGGEPPPAVDYAYHADGSLATMDYGFGMHVERLYAPAGRLVDLRYTKPDGAVISDFAYTHDAAGNILSKTTDFGLIQYGYDALDRLVLADYGWKADETFSYDLVGNRTADAEHPVWHYDAANQLLAYGAGPHDPAGQTPPTVPAFTFAYDANGSTVSKTDPAAGTADQYGYSFDNRMNEVWRNGELIAQYFYDHRAQRVKMDNYMGGAFTGSTWFLYCQEGLLAEYDRSGTLTKKYSWQPDQSWSTDPLFQEYSIGIRLYYINDNIFTGMKLINMNYQTFWQADYDSFGKCTIISESTKNNLRFPGQYYHVVNDISANWYRDFHCQLGRYIEIEPSRYIVSSDGLVFFRDDENYNFYSYTRNNPIKYLDFNGKHWEYAFGWQIPRNDCWYYTTLDKFSHKYNCPKDYDLIFIQCLTHSPCRQEQDEANFAKQSCEQRVPCPYSKIFWTEASVLVVNGSSRKFFGAILCCGKKCCRGVHQ